MENITTQLKPKYNLFTAICLVVGVVIGIGIYFRTGSLMMLTKGNVHIALWGWIAGAVLAILGALCMAELGGTVKDSGGDIAYAKAAIGDWFATILGLGSVILTYPALNGILSWVASGFILDLAGSSKDYQYLIAFVIYTSLFVSSLLKPSIINATQGVLSIIKLLPLFAIAIAVFFLPESNYGYTQVAPAGTEGLVNAMPLFIAALIPIVFTFDGWIMVTTVQNEIKNAERNLPIALIAGILFVTVVYISIYTAFINVLPAIDLASDGVIPFGVAKILFGESASKIVMVGIIISAIGGLNGYSFMTTRRIYALANLGLFPFANFFKKVDVKLDTPINSAILMYIISNIYLLTNAMGQDFSSYGIVLQLFMFIFIYAGLIKMKYAGKLNKGGYHTPFFPLVPVLAIICWTALAFGIFFTDKETTRYMIIALAIYSLALPVYFLMRLKKAKSS